MKTPVAWFKINIGGMERAKRVYESMLGVRLSQLESHVHAIHPPPGMEAP